MTRCNHRHPACIFPVSKANAAVSVGWMRRRFRSARSRRAAYCLLYARLLHADGTRRFRRKPQVSSVSGTPSARRWARVRSSGSPGTSVSSPGGAVLAALT